jgi:hypothetical protein
LALVVEDLIMVQILFFPTLLALAAVLVLAVMVQPVVAVVVVAVHNLTLQLLRVELALRHRAQAADLVSEHRGRPELDMVEEVVALVRLAQTQGVAQLEMAEMV